VPLAPPPALGEVIGHPDAREWKHRGQKQRDDGGRTDEDEHVGADHQDGDGPGFPTVSDVGAHRHDPSRSHPGHEAGDRIAREGLHGGADEDREDQSLTRISSGS
jgi:hypothetical protein